MEREILDIAVNAYMKIFEENQPFYSVISSSIYELPIDKKVKANLIALVGASVRHHLLYKKTFPVIGKFQYTKSFYALAVCLTDIFFTKRYDKEDNILTAVNYLKVNEPEANVEKFEEIARIVSPVQLLNILNLKPGSIGSFSIRYNVPEWIIELWSRQYSKNLCIKTIVALTNKQKQYVKINKLFNLTENLSLPEQDFIPSEIDSDVYEYVGKQQLRKNQFISDNKIYGTNEIENEILKKIKVNYVNSAAYYFYEKSNFHIDLMNALDGHCEIGIFCKDYNKATKSIDYIKRFKKDKVYFAQSDIDNLDVHLTNNVNLFVLYPNSSNFNYVNSSPEYLLSFDKNSLDLILRNERDDLNEASKHVIMGGYLVYVTHTMNKKENTLMIENFLNEHSNYSLVCEKEFFNVNKSASVFGYYAILVRNL